MPDLPEYMKKKERQPDQEFTPDEKLFRRVRPEDWDDDEVNEEAIEFPDMSVTRQKYGPANSVRWEGQTYLNWGVIEFSVNDIPPSIPFQGAVTYAMKAVHDPLKYNYPHTEIQVFESRWGQAGKGIHLDKKAMPGVPREAQQLWREMLRRRCRISLKPGEEAV